MENEHNHGPGCGCGASKKVVIEFDDETSVECEILGTFDANGKEYVALIAQDGSDEILLYGVKEDGDDLELIDIEDEEEFQRAAEVLDTLLDEDEEDDS